MGKEFSDLLSVIFPNCMGSLHLFQCLILEVFWVFMYKFGDAFVSRNMLSELNSCLYQSVDAKVAFITSQGTKNLWWCWVRTYCNWEIHDVLKYDTYYVSWVLSMPRTLNNLDTQISESSKKMLFFVIQISRYMEDNFIPNFSVFNDYRHWYISNTYNMTLCFLK